MDTKSNRERFTSWKVEKTYVHFAGLKYILISWLSLSALRHSCALTETVTAFVNITGKQVTTSCREVKYYLPNMEFKSCDQVCESHGLLCTARDHGFKDENILNIFQKLLGKSCKTGFNNTDKWDEVGPSYKNMRDELRGRCMGWKDIPKQIICEAKPLNENVRRLCPCINDVTYHLNDKNLVSCNDSCVKHHLNCAVEFHGYTDENVFRILETLLGEKVKSYSSSTDLYKFEKAGPKVERVRKTCKQWKAIPPRINCEKKKVFSTTSTLCPCVNECSKPLGMESGLIPDSAITASSEFLSFYNADKGRLRHDFPGAWIPKYFNENQWLQVYLGPYYIINKIATQGRSKENQWVTSYLLVYSEDQNNLIYYRDTNNEVRLFRGNNDSDTVVINLLRPNIRARLVRVKPRRFFGWMAMRIELYGCLNVKTELSTSTGVPELVAPTEIIESPTSTGILEPSAPTGNLELPTPTEIPEPSIPTGNLDLPTPTGIIEPSIPTGTLDLPKPTGIPEPSIPTGTLDLPTPTGIPEPSIPTENLEFPTATRILEQSIPRGTLELPTPTGILEPSISIKSLESPTGTKQPLLPTRTLELPTSIGTLKSSKVTATFKSLTPTGTLKLSTTTTTEIVLRKLKSDWNRAGPTSLLIKWERLQGHITGYNVSYQAILTASIAVSNSTLFELSLNESQTRVHISGLETFTRYNITVTPIGREGLRIKSNYVLADTCRCPRRLKADWWVNRPYSFPINQSGTFGIIPDVVKKMVNDVCEFCPLHGYTDVDVWLLDTEYKESRERRSTNERVLSDNVDLIFPVTRFPFQQTYLGYNYVPIVNVQGFALITLKIKEQEFYARAAASSLFDCWPYFFIYTVMMIAAGIILWILELHGNQGQFSPSFARGVTDGIWWSFATTTTVGYGDRYPISVLARVFAITWFLVGFVLNSFLISALTSSISVEVIEAVVNPTPGKTVGVLEGSPGDLYGNVMKKISGTSVNFANLTALSRGLMVGDVDSAIMDINVASYRSDLFNDSWCTVGKVISYPFSVGAAVNEHADKLERFFRVYLKENQAIFTELALNVRGKNVTQKQNKRSPIKTETPKNDPLWTSIKWSGILLAVVFVLGITFHSLRKWRKRKEQNQYCDSSAQQNNTSRPLCKSQHIRCEMQLVVQDFHDNVTRLYRKLRKQHLNERQKLLRLIKEQNKQRGSTRLCYEKCNKTVPTPRANLVSFVNKNLEIDKVSMNMFELEEVSYIN